MLLYWMVLCASIFYKHWKAKIKCMMNMDNKRNIAVIQNLLQAKRHLQADCAIC